MRFLRILILSIFLAPSFAAGSAASESKSAPLLDEKPKIGKAVFAGGCFWCTESDFQDMPGVIDAVSGYIGGKEKDPTYAQVSSGKTGHTEAVMITFDPAKISYEDLVKSYWLSIDPTVKNRQFCDTGPQYRTAIFYFDAAQQKVAEESKKDVASKLKQTVHTEIAAATTFYAAEDYHQDYYKKNPVRYKYYRYSCGRDERLRELWGDKAVAPSQGKSSL